MAKGPRASNKSDGWFTGNVNRLTARILTVAGLGSAIGVTLAAWQPVSESASSICSTIGWCQAHPDHQPPSDEPSKPGALIARGTTGWIYAGSRIGETWQVSNEDAKEPALTIDTIGVPVTGETYQITRAVYLRASAPADQQDSSRPPMADSKGQLLPGRTVKADVIRSIRRPESTWIWAHVTVLN
jgi:hypothetical protein